MFIYIFILNKNINLDYNYEENLYLVKEVFFRAGSEGFLNYQPIWRIIFLYSAFFFSLFIISKYKYYEFKIYLYFLVTISFFVISLGTIWVAKLHIYYPNFQIGLLYFARTMATFNIFFCMSLIVFVLQSKLSSIIKFSFIVSIYILGKLIFQIQGYYYHQL